jgi:hypothetical protein
VVAIFAPLSITDTETAATVWRQRAEAISELPEPVEPDCELTVAHTGDGATGRFVVDKQGAVELLQALRTASGWDGKDDTRPTTRRSGDALVDVCAFFNANHNSAGTPRHRAHVELSVDPNSLAGNPLAWTIDHGPLGPSTTDAYLCDCVIHRVERSANSVLAYGRSVYTVPPDLWKAVAARDGGCRFPGCDRPIRWCDAHHIQYWRNLGHTDIDNLALLCSRHHHLIHKPGWHLKLLDDATLNVIRPGHHHQRQPTPPQPRPQSVDSSSKGIASRSTRDREDRC